jgi:subtilisin family serine protease
VSKRLRLLYSLSVSLLLLGLCLSEESNAKKKVSSDGDLPRFSYPVKGSVSKLMEADDATFNVFARQVRIDLDSIFRDYDIADKATLRMLLRAEVDLETLSGDYSAALRTTNQLREEQEKPSAKLTTGLVGSAWLEAAIATKSTSGPAFEKSFRKLAEEKIDALPWEVVQDDMKETYAATKIFTPNSALAQVETDLDPAVRKSGGLDNHQAWELLSYRTSLLSFIPIEEPLEAVLKKYITAHTVVKPDIWEAREVTLGATDKTTPVLVAIWDSGIDISLFPDQLFTDPHPTASGTHGLAYDDQGNPATPWLYPLTPEQEKAYPGFRDEIKGFFDLQNGVDSPEADTLQKKVRTLSSDELHDLFELEKWLGFYIHGTHCAGIAVRGNRAARLVVARFNDQLSDLPFPPTEPWARRLGADFQQIADYFRTRNVRVVNMSWSDSVPEFETWLSKQGGGADPAERKKRAGEIYAIWREAIQSAIKNTPNTLFVAAAGNSDSDAGFGGDVPASLHLPNLITVGAVNQAGDETSFTSYGDTVLVDADGYNVESYVPGGARLRLSGTSMATPNVVNLAAKLFALDPTLTPAQVIDLIRQGATASQDGRRYLMDEKRSVELWKEQTKK